MNDTDPTMDLIHSLNRADPTEWGRIVYGVPIFVEHDGYEQEQADGTKRLVVVPKGDPAPANARLLYSVDAERLKATVEAINRNYDAWGKPIKLFVGQSPKAPGHSDPAVPQTDNPAIAGFGRKAYLGTFGPQNRLAIKTDAFFKRGFENAPAEYPERSPEFLPRTNAITGVALLRTDPRLPMGMVSYQQGDEEIIRYGVGFMADKSKKPDETPAEDPKPEGEGNPGASDGNPNPDAPKPDAPQGDPQQLEPLQEHEIKFCNRMMRYMEEQHPAFKYLCGEHKKYMDTQAAMAQPGMTAPGATNGSPTQGGNAEGGDDPKKPKPDERLDMSQTTDQDRIDYAETKAKLDKLEKKSIDDEARILALETENATLYAERAIDGLIREGKVIKSRDAEIKKLVGMKPEERKAHLDNIKLNYADAERSPARGSGFLPVDAGHAEGGDDEASMPSASELVRYAEENKVDISTDAGLKQAMAALTKKK